MFWTHFVMILVLAASARAKLDRLDEVLRGWESANAAVSEVRYTFRLTTTTRGFDDPDVIEGDVLIKGPELARVNLRERAVKYTCLFTQKHAHLYQWGIKSQAVCDLHPADKGLFVGNPSPSWGDFIEGTLLSGIVNDLHWVYTGLPVCDLCAQFDVQLEKEDAHWIYLRVLPREGDRLRRFSEMQVVLHRKTLRTRRIHISWAERNFGDNQWDFDYPKQNEPVTAEMIKRDLPTDWERIEFPLRK